MKSSASIDLLLLCMPGHTIRWPSLAMGSLLSVLTREGFHSELWYANLRFAQEVGLKAAVKMENNWSTEYLCEWLFQTVLFPDHVIPVDKYVKEYLGGKRLKAEARNALASQRGVWRDKSEAFLHRLCQDIIQVNPMAVGFSLNVTQLFSSLALMRLLRQISPHLITVVGGASCETVGAEDLHVIFSELIDFAVSGDAEGIIGPLIKLIRQHGREIKYRDVPYGVIAPIHRKVGYPADPKFWDKGPRASVFDLNDLPEPDHTPYYDTLDAMPEIARNMTRVAVFESSRGCARGEKRLCNFCGDCGALPTYRKKNSEKVWHELTSIHKKFGVKKFVATDNMIPPDYFKTLLPRLANMPEKLSLFYEIRPNISKSQARMLKAAGIDFVQSGIESLSDDALKVMNKGVSVWQNIQCLKWCRQYGINVSWFIITRIPGEQDEWNQEQCNRIPLLVHLPPPRFVGIIRPDRHSPFFKKAKQIGMDIRIKPKYRRLFGVPLIFHSRFVFHLEDARIISQMSDEMDFIFRPGLHQLNHAVEFWRAIYIKHQPNLLMRKTTDGLLISDTRFNKSLVQYHLNGHIARLLTFCDTAPTQKRLTEWFAKKLISPEIAKRLINDLENKKLVIKIGGRIISLVLDDPVLEPVAEKDLPVGWIEEEG